MSPFISVHIVVWNSMRFLPDLLKTLDEQTYEHKQVFVIDNGSSDGVEAFLREEYPSVRFLRNVRNLGFAGAHNQGMRYVLEHWGDDLADKAVLVLSPEMLLTPTCLEHLARLMASDVRVGSVGGKILRAYREGFGDDFLRETIKSDRIDSAGFIFQKNLKAVHRGAGELDENYFHEEEEIFGASSDLVLYHAIALKSVQFEEEFFVQDFGEKGVDVDLAFRLRRVGWNILFTPKAVAYHFCGSPSAEKKSFWRRSKSVRKDSHTTLRNQWLLLCKNLDLWSGVCFLPRFIIREVPFGVCKSFVQPSRLMSFFFSLKLLPKILKKRFHLARKEDSTERFYLRRFLSKQNRKNG